MKKRDLKAILLAIALTSASFSLTGCCEDEMEVSLNDVLDDVSDNTCTDEILKSEEHSYLLDYFYTLEKYLTFSETLHSLDLDEKIDTLTYKMDNKEISIEEIEKSIKEFEDLEELKDEDEELKNKYNQKLQELICIEGIVNEWIKEKGYSEIYSVGKLIVKGKMVDTEGLIEDEYSNFNICKNPNTSANYEPENVDVVYINQEQNITHKVKLKDISIFGGNSNLTNLVNSIYDSEIFMENTETEKNKYNLEIYNEKRNIELKGMIENIKLALYSTYEEKDYGVYQIESNDEVKKLYNSRKKYIGK